MCDKQCVLLFIFIIYATCQLREPNVKIPQGLLVGTRVYPDSGQAVNVFLGIPYVAPPIENLRFAPPRRHGGWNGTYFASGYRPSCPQLPINNGSNESEDCLYLNIWAPSNAVKYGPLPVVLYIDGHEFAKGRRVPIPGQDLAMEGIIVITINYRLNVFGFLCFGTPEVRGNMGLLDQYFALLWVRENIKYFGGDQDKITLFGHSAGAASVALHMISPRTAGYFQRAIIASGAAVSPWAVAKDPQSASRDIARILGCLNGYSSSILRCLWTKNTQDILKAYEEYSESGNATDMLLPVVDNFLPRGDQYLPMEPRRALMSGTYMQVPILTGISDPIFDPQYSQWTELASQGYFQLQQYIELSKIPEIMKQYKFNGKNREQLFELIKWNYVTSSNGDVRVLLQQLKNLDFESKIEAPHFSQLSYLLSSYVQPIYVYNFDHGDFILNSTADWVITTDLLLLFGPLLLNQIGRRRFNINELRYSKYIKQLWTNFIIFGNPTPNNQLKVWRRYTALDNYIEYLGTNNNLKEEAIRRNRRVQFWTQLLPKFASAANIDTNSIPKELQNSLVPGSGYRHAMYTLSGLVVALLVLLLICIVLIKKRAKERERHFQMVY